MAYEFLKYIILPSNLFTLLIVISLICVLVFRFNKPVIILCSLTIALYFVFGSGPVAYFLLSKLEYEHPAYDVKSQTTPLDAIVILTADAEIKPLAPVSSNINPSSAYRILEASRIYNAFPESEIIITGAGNVPELMQQVLLSLNVPDASIKLDSLAASTYYSAVNLRPMLNDKKFVLVTSAGHMPRAMAVFQSQGLAPIAAPTEFISRQNIFAAQYLPSSRHLIHSDLAVHELLAIFWYQITGKIQ